MNRRGLTLPETIISIFLLASGFIVLFRMMHAALQFQSGIDSQQTAVMLAEREVEQVRAWNIQTHGPATTTPFSDWTGCPGMGGPAPIADYPDYRMTVTAEQKELYSPCSLFELNYANPDARKVLSQSARQLTVSVAWKDRNFSLCTLVGAPTGEPGAIAVGPDTPIDFSEHDGHDFTVSATDSSGRAIPDLVYTWYLDGVGDGTVDFNRDGRGANVTNEIYDASYPPNPTGVGLGPCTLVARARYRGKEMRGVSGQLQMHP